MSLNIVPANGLLWRAAGVSDRTCRLLENLRSVGTASGSVLSPLCNTCCTLLPFNGSAMPKQVFGSLQVGLFFSVAIFEDDKLSTKFLYHCLSFVNSLCD